MTDALASSLEAKHKQLEKDIAAEMKRPYPDDIKLHQLKKQKLHLKEQMAGLVPA